MITFLFDLLIIGIMSASFGVWYARNRARNAARARRRTERS